MPFDDNLYRAFVRRNDSGERPLLAGREVRFVEHTVSTMDDARAGAAAGIPPGTVYVAGAQSAGRGRQGRTWLSAASAGLYATYHLRAANSGDAPLYSLAAALASGDAILETSDLPTVLKWPNDVQHLTSDGMPRKLSGVLAESRSAPGRSGVDVFLGVGINVRAAPLPPELESVATSIEASGGRFPVLEELLAALSCALSRWAALMEASPPGLVKAWRARLATLGTRVQLRTPSGDVEGEAVDVTSGGELVLRHDDGRVVSYAAGDVTTVARP